MTIILIRFLILKRKSTMNAHTSIVTQYQLLQREYQLIYNNNCYYVPELINIALWEQYNYKIDLTITIALWEQYNYKILLDEEFFILRILGSKLR